MITDIKHYKTKAIKGVQPIDELQQRVHFSCRSIQGSLDSNIREYQQLYNENTTEQTLIVIKYEPDRMFYPTFDDEQWLEYQRSHLSTYYFKVLDPNLIP